MQSIAKEDFDGGAPFSLLRQGTLNLSLAPAKQEWPAQWS
eukprot:COSAG04_NODE_5228_length_1694_cov_1.980564_4_plen_40_part_00